LKPWLTAAVVAAALMPLALLFMHTSPAKGITLGQVVKAFEKTPHVYVAKFGPGGMQLIRESWISRSRNANLCLTAEGQARVLYDLSTKKKFAGSERASGRGGADMNDLEYATVRLMVDSALGFDFRTIPAGATWTRVPEGTSDKGDLYELACTAQTSLGKTLLLKWKITIDPLTQLPQQIEDFRMMLGQEEWRHIGRREYRYLTDGEMAAVMGEPPRSSATY
jgi:hypothetical protein